MSSIGTFEECAEKLEELSRHYKLDGNDHKSRDYQLTASELRTVEFMPPDPSSLDGISRTARDHIAEWMAFGEIEELKQYRQDRPYLKELTRVKSLGPKLAKKIYDNTGVETIDGLEKLLDSGEIEDVHGIGPSTATTFRRSVAQMNRKS